jgi:hypothetical protein
VTPTPPSTIKFPRAPPQTNGRAARDQGPWDANSLPSLTRTARMTRVTPTKSALVWGRMPKAAPVFCT